MPVVDQYIGEAGGNVDERIAISIARFDQRDRRTGVFGEITRNDAAGRARANNGNVVPLPGHQRLSFASILSINQRPVPSASLSRSLIQRLIGLCLWRVTLKRRRGKSP